MTSEREAEPESDADVTPPRSKGGRPTTEQVRRRRIAKLAEDLENVDLELAEQALGIMRDGTASASVRVQAGQLLASVKGKIEPPPKVSPGEADLVAAREILERKYSGIGWTGDVPFAEWLAAMRGETEEARAERDRLQKVLAENDVLRARLEAVELRPVAGAEAVDAATEFSSAPKTVFGGPVRPRGPGSSWDSDRQPGRRS